ncbi:hypothetical protein DFJ73DRAFT_776506 [Zopfochytrium polystomum]|nr:hypothetical protein DFJ73DRAFT_776506 [Zopfochytrium polystomum]
MSTSSLRVDCFCKSPLIVDVQRSSSAAGNPLLASLAPHLVDIDVEGTAYVTKAYVTPTSSGYLNGRYR